MTDDGDIFIAAAVLAGANHIRGGMGEDARLSIWPCLTCRLGNPVLWSARAGWVHEDRRLDARHAAYPFTAYGALKTRQSNASGCIATIIYVAVSAVLLGMFIVSYSLQMSDSSQWHANYLPLFIWGVITITAFALWRMR